MINPQSNFFILDIQRKFKHTININRRGSHLRQKAMDKTTNENIPCPQNNIEESNRKNITQKK